MRNYLRILLKIRVRHAELDSASHKTKLSIEIASVNPSFAMTLFEFLEPTLISLFILFNIVSEAQISDSTFLKLYKSSDMIFTGVLKSKYQLPSYSDCDENLRFLLEFDLTEIQKGTRRMKMQIETPDSAFKMNKEYLIFCNKIKSHENKIYIKTHSEEVCLNCENPGIKAVYRIVNRRPFSTIKEPLDSNNMRPKGCGCH